MRVEEFVGERIREHRERLGITQEELGRRLEPLLGKAWPRQAVWAAEQGKRSFTAAELVVLATVLKTRPARLITPPLSVDEVEMPSGTVVPAREARDLPLADPSLLEARELAQQFRQAAASAHRSSALALDAGSALATQVERHIEGLMDELVNDPDEITFADDQGTTEEGKEEV